MLNRVEAEQRLTHYWRLRNWPAAYELLQPILRTATGTDLGWAHLQLALTQYAQSPTLATTALERVDEAIGLIEGDVRTQVVAYVTGMNITLYIDDLDRFDHYARPARTLVAGTHPDVIPWTGRVCGNTAYGLQRRAELAPSAESARDLYLHAAQQMRRTVRFYEEHVGPFDERDRSCQLEAARTGLADLLWQLGRRDEALEVVGPLLESSSHACVPYWLGRIALQEGRLADAVDLLRTALDRLTMTWAPHYRMEARITEALGEAYARIGDVAELRRLVEPMIVQAAQVRNPGLVYRLQRLLVENSRGEVSVSC